MPNFAQIRFFACPKMTLLLGYFRRIAVSRFRPSRKFVRLFVRKTRKRHKFRVKSLAESEVLPIDPPITALAYDLLCRGIAPEALPAAIAYVEAKRAELEKS